MNIETDLLSSDSWDVLTHSLLDVADIEIPNIGKLECRAVLAEAKVMQIPLEVSSNRIGYVAVRIDQSLREGVLLGFVKTAVTEAIPLSNLGSLHELLEHLNQMRKTEPLKIQVNLRQWLQNSFEPAWQPFRGIWDITNQRNLALGFRGNSQSSEINIQRAKVIDLGFSLGNQSVSLVIAIVEQVNQEVCIVAQVYPFGVEKTLPPDLRLLLHSKSWSLPKEIRARNQDVCIQTNQFWCDPGEEFSIELALNEFSVMENFVV